MPHRGDARRGRDHSPGIWPSSSPVPGKTNAPRPRERAAGRFDDIPAATYSPTRKPCSTIGSEGLNFRVRDGNGWDPFDVATGNLRLRELGVLERSLHMRKSV